MNILHLEASPGWGGQEIRILREAQGMRSRGYNVFFGVMKNAILGEKARSDGFEIYYLNFNRFGWIVTLFRLLRILRKHQIDIIHTHSSLDAWIGGIAGRIARKKIVRTRHLSTAGKRGLNSTVLYGLLSDFVITTCKAVIHKISVQSKKPIQYFQSIPTGIDLQHVYSKILDNEEGLRKKYRLENVFLIGTACFMRSWKGIEDFLKAAHRMRNVKEMKWIIIGGGHANRYIQLMKEMDLDDVVFFTGHLENPFPTINALDVFALLSTAHEGVSQAILQAAALKKPLIATPVGGLPEVCQNGETGIIVPTFNPEAVAEAANRLMYDKRLCKQFGEAAHKLVAQQFSFEQTLFDTENVYKNLLNRN